MTEYELDKWCAAHCEDEDPQCFNCPAFIEYWREHGRNSR